MVSCTVGAQPTAPNAMPTTTAILFTAAPSDETLIPVHGEDLEDRVPLGKLLMLLQDHSLCAVSCSSWPSPDLIRGSVPAIPVLDPAARKTGIPGMRPGMTGEEHFPLPFRPRKPSLPLLVMAGLDPAIPLRKSAAPHRSGIPGPRPGMTERGNAAGGMFSLCS
ncbi:hypothetical protein DC522_13460 [Microvirga sp. KLBC 81]|nr:hypothetical protein DC522_13460 [Microvirga sp. KLBC 81]